MEHRLRLASLALAGIGLVDSLYLTWIKFAHAETFCSVIGDCETVNNSPYSEIWGIPIALLGAGAYLALLGLLYLERRGGFWGDYALLGAFGITLAGVLYSAYLTYIEVAVLQAVCPFCVISAITLLILLILTIIRLFRGEFAVT